SLPVVPRQRGDRGYCRFRISLCERFRNRPRQLRRADRRQRGIVHEPLTIEKSEEGSERREGTGGRAALETFARAAGEPRAEVGGGERLQMAQAGRLAEMLEEEIAERGEVAPIARHRVRRGAALVPQPRLPALDRFGEVRKNGVAM